MTGTTEFSLGLQPGRSELEFSEVLTYCSNQLTKGGALLVFDEFQDIANVEGVEAAFRTSFQTLSPKLPILVLGSQKHLLGRIFGDPGAPLANWGRMLEVGRISEADYLAYANARFANKKVEISANAVAHLFSRLRSNPECMNLVCYLMQRTVEPKDGIYSNVDIDLAITNVVRERQSVYMHHIQNFTAVERTFLAALAKNEPLKHPLSKSFLKAVDSSTGTIRPLVQRLLDRSIIYDDPEGLVLGDPLLSYFFRYS
jgi:hypothetical protein